MRRHSLNENVIWTTIGNVTYAGCQWGILIAIAKLGTPEWVGKFALGLAITAPVMLLANLQLRAVQATDVASSFAFGHYLALRLITGVTAALVIALVILISRLDFDTALIVAAIGLAKLIESVSDAYYGFLQKHEQMDRIAKSLILKGILSLIVMTTVIWFTGQLLWGILSMAVAWLGVVLSYDLHSARRARDTDSSASPVILEGLALRWDWPRLRKLAIIAFPLGIVMMLNSLNVNVPRYFLEYVSGSHVLGIFAALAYLQVAEGTVINALGQSATPRLARGFAHHNPSDFTQLVRRLILIGLSLGGVGVLAAITVGTPVLRLLYSPEYAAYNNALVWLMIGAAVASIAAVTGYSLTAARCFAMQIPLLAIETCVLAITCLPLIHRFGLAGAAMSYVFSKTVLVILSLLLLYRKVMVASSRVEPIPLIHEI